MYAKILSLGHWLPALKERNGLVRPIAEEPVGPSTLAARAAENAFGRVGLRPEDIDFIVFATMTPDVTFPGSACYLQSQLDCGTVPALDIRAQCAGFLFALDIAEKFVRAQRYRCVLVAGGEVYSSGVDYERQPQVAELFGDGAGVVVVVPSSGREGIEAIVTHADGSKHRSFWCEYPSSRQHPCRVTREDLGLGKHLLEIDRDVVARFGRERLPEVVHEALDRAGCGLGAIDHFFLSHVLPDVASEAGRSLGVDSARVTVASASYGHLGAAALPVALSEAVNQGKVGRGARICLAACGAGFAWGAAVVQL